MSESDQDNALTRRDFLARTAITTGTIALNGVLARAAIAGQTGSGSQKAPAIITSPTERPLMPAGVMSGDITHRHAVVWSQTDRPARMVVELGFKEDFKKGLKLEGPVASAESAFTARIDLQHLPSGQKVYYRVWFESLNNRRARSEISTGSFLTPSKEGRSIKFAFSGDEAGQGWGINPDFGGYRLYETMRKFEPDFFIHSGDQIYADGVIKPEVTLDDGSVWKNIVVPAKTKVAETLDEFRGNFAYNLMDENKRRFAAEVPFLVQWDDHETRNNWYPGQLIGVPAYTEKRADVLSARSRQAMFEFNPFRINSHDPEQIYRAFRYGSLLDVFMLDERSYRGPNSANTQPNLDASSAFLGSEQLKWLKQSLNASRATWKVIASDMPLGLVVPDGNPDVPTGTFEAWANADDGLPSGRELELASLLAFIKEKDIKNVVWVTADVHYAAAHFYNPDKAKFTDFRPFWEFVAGPINAGSFGPNALDATFGPEIVFTTIPPEGIKPNRPPSEGMQFFGFAEIDKDTEILRVSLVDVNGKILFTKELEAES